MAILDVHLAGGALRWALLWPAASVACASGPEPTVTVGATSASSRPADAVPVAKPRPPLVDVPDCRDVLRVSERGVQAWLHVTKFNVTWVDEAASLDLDKFRFIDGVFHEPAKWHNPLPPKTASRLSQGSYALVVGVTQNEDESWTVVAITRVRGAFDAKGVVENLKVGDCPSPPLDCKGCLWESNATFCADRPHVTLRSQGDWYPRPRPCNPRCCSAREGEP